MGSPEKPLDVEMGDMDETNKLNPNDDVEFKVKDQQDRFTGLKKEELLEISSQKKWVVARWVLFIFFWLAWIGMLVGAIIIVVQAPRCKPEPTPPWYQDTVVYQADVRKFAGDLDGMAKHVDYVKSMNSKTLTICHANDPEDLKQVVGKDDEKFKALLEASHDKEYDNDLKVVVDLRIDALRTSSAEFVESATEDCAAPASGEGCNMFFWKSNDSLPASGTWVYDSARGEHYKVTDDDDSLAYVNYADDSAINYIKDVVKEWIRKGADGFQLRDMSMIGVGNAMKVVEAVQMAINETQVAVEEDKRKVVGLFLLASDQSDQSSLFPGGNDTDSAPVVINTGLANAASAEDVRNTIQSWRNKTEPFIASYAANTMDMELLAKRLGKEKAAGLTLFTYALPGVPVVRSGDEALLEDDFFTWNSTGKVQAPNNASLAAITELSNTAKLRVDKHTSRRSLRWDNDDSQFNFKETNDSSVVAIYRKWDIKPAVIAAYNPSNEDRVVSVTMKENEGDKGQVLASSTQLGDAKDFNFKAISIKSGQTLLLEVEKK